VIPLRVIVPTDAVPPSTELGTNVTLCATGAFTISVFDKACVPTVAVIFALTSAATATDVTTNVALVCPAAIFTLAGTFAATLLLDSKTVIPAAGAGSLTVTVAVDDAPPVTVAGEKTSVLGARTRTVRLDETLTPPALAVIVAVAGVVTALVVILNVALV
jgi:hypothetical protein